MKKITCLPADKILPIVFLFAVVFFLSSKADAQTNTDCQEVFNKESNSCLKESSKCINSCVDKANKVMSLIVDGGKVNLECQRSVCDPASKSCNDKAMANFRACGKSGKESKTKTAKEIKPSWLEFLGINPYQTWLS